MKQPRRTVTDDLWRCPKCGARLVNRNQWHSCGRATLDDWLVGLGPRGRALYDRFETMIASCGEYHIAPAKTRIAFLARVRFGGITKLREDRMDFFLALPSETTSPRILGTREEAPGWFVHRLRVSSPDELDDEIQDWIRTSYRLMGMRERLAD